MKNFFKNLFSGNLADSKFEGLVLCCICMRVVAVLFVPSLMKFSGWAVNGFFAFSILIVFVQYMNGVPKSMKNMMVLLVGMSLALFAPNIISFF